MTVKGPLGPLNGLIGSTNLLALPVRKDIINEIFHLDLTEQEFRSRDDGLSAYFSDWFEEQCEAAASQVSVQTHQDLLEILAYIQSTNHNEHRSRIVSKLCTTSSATRRSPVSGPNDETLNASLTLAVRIWLSISIDSLQHFLTPGHFVAWNSGQYLADVVTDAFSRQMQTSEKVKLPKVFTAANLEKIAGIQVQWTSNLADHLSLKDDDTKVMLFHQASFLELHQESRWYA